MTADQAAARSAYESAVASARAQLDADLLAADRTYDAAVMAATAHYASTERFARAQYWAARNNSWTTAIRQPGESTAKDTSVTYPPPDTEEQ